MCTYVNTRVAVRDSELVLPTMPSLALYSLAPYRQECSSVHLGTGTGWPDLTALPFPSLALQSPSTPLLQEGSPNLQLIYLHFFCPFILSERQGQDTVDHQVWDSVIGSVQNGGIRRQDKDLWVPRD